MARLEIEKIKCHGIKTHNLKNIDIEFPLNQFSCVTGVSGSGKSSLIFDTIYAEAHRRFLETLSTYERQFFGKISVGEFVDIEPLPFAIALKQSNRSSDPRSVVASAADISFPLMQVFSRLAENICYQCGSPVEVTTADELYVSLIKETEKKSFETLVLSYAQAMPSKTEEISKTCKSMLAEGFIEVFFEEKFFTIEDLMHDKSLMKSISGKTVFVCLDKLIWEEVVGDSFKERLFVALQMLQNAPHIFEMSVISEKKQKFKIQNYFIKPFCAKCNKVTRLTQSADLEWNSALGGCTTCLGIGNIAVLDEQKIIPNPALSLEEGALKAWQTPAYNWMQVELMAACKKNHINVKKPYESLDKEVKKWIWTGESKTYKKYGDFVSLEDFFKALEQERYKPSSRIVLAKYRKYITCPKCNGERLNEAGRSVVVEGYRFPELMQVEIKDVLGWLKKIQSLKIFKEKEEALRDWVEELELKLGMLKHLGLGSCALWRRCKTLSGGEYQRVMLTKVLGSGLSDALYILDEPSVGLGRSEIPTLIQAVRTLQEKGNTLLLVDHDKEIVMAADFVAELGPGGGVHGGEVVGAGKIIPKCFDVAGILTQTPSLKKPIKKMPQHNLLKLKNFSLNYCKNLDIEIAEGKLTTFLGPSGAGKSTLALGGICAAVDKFLEKGQTSNAQAEPDDRVGSWTHFELNSKYNEKNFELIYTTQTAHHRSSHSTIATSLGVMDFLRKMLAQTEEAQELDFDAGDFTFIGRGACPACEGRGYIKEDLFFLGEVEEKCEMCDGSRFKPEVSQVAWLGKNIVQWMNTTIAEALSLLKSIEYLSNTLRMAADLGLDHLSLGMTTSQLSGGELQRLKLTSVLSSKNAKTCLVVLDEPTRGLSDQDVAKLIKTLLRLCSQGHTFVIVEHHDLFEKYAHIVVKMGPGAGKAGGEIVETLASS